MSKLIDLLKDLGENADLVAEYEKDPEPVIKRYDLTDKERKALLSGDSEKLREMTGLTQLRMTNSTVKSYD